MPLPIAAWLAGAGVGAALVALTGKSLDEIQADLTGWVVNEVAARSGLGLDPNDPFSDASIAGAISDRIQVPLRSVRDRKMIEEDMLAFAGRKIEERTGMQVTNLADINATRADVMRFAGGKISEHVGIPLTDITNKEQTISDLKEWGLSQAYAQMSGDAATAVDMFAKSGVNVDVVVNQVNSLISEKNGAEPLSGKAVVLAMLHSGMAQQIARVGARALSLSMKSRRQLQMAAASMRFRERHGSRMKYERLTAEDRAKTLEDRAKEGAGQ